MQHFLTEGIVCFLIYAILFDVVSSLLNISQFLLKSRNMSFVEIV